MSHGTKRTSKLIIQRAKREDMKAIAKIVSSSAEWYRPIVDEKDMAEHDVDEKWQEINFKRREFWVGKSSERETVGTVSLQYFGECAYLGYVYLHADHTGKGYGKTLLEHARERAKEQGMDQMVLIAHPQAKWATKAYERFGFQRIAKQKEDVLSWNKGVLKPYYEEGFHLYAYDLKDEAQVS